MLSNRILTDWKQAFPILHPFSKTNKLLKVLGPVLIGIELIRLPHTKGYRPCFVMYPLWKSNIRECLSGPMVLNQLSDEKGRLFDIKTNEHEVVFEGAVAGIKNNGHFFSEQVIHLNQLKKLIDDYAETPPFCYKPHSFAQAVFRSNKVKLSLYINTEEALAEYQEIKRFEWDADNFKMFNQKIDSWLEDLADVIQNRDSFLKIIGANKSDPQIQKLNLYELTN